ncbi:transcription-repair coupling factor [Klebsiella pneumoniae]|nr:transcription-repair coupling factor [Klebsiella pneumoniae]
MKKGQRLSRDALRDQLEGAGYRHVDQVMEHGEYATPRRAARPVPDG